MKSTLIVFIGLLLPNLIYPQTNKNEVLVCSCNLGTKKSWLKDINKEQEFSNKKTARQFYNNLNGECSRDQMSQISAQIYHDFFLAGQEFTSFDNVEHYSFEGVVPVFGTQSISPFHKKRNSALIGSLEATSYHDTGKRKYSNRIFEFQLFYMSSVHLDSHSARRRKASIEELIRFSEHNPDKPLIIAGDFNFTNCKKDQKSIMLLEAHFKEATKNVGATVKNPDKRIDMIWVSKRSSEVLIAEAKKLPRDCPYLDHAGVCAKIIFTKEAENDQILANDPE